MRRATLLAFLPSALCLLAASPPPAKAAGAIDWKTDFAAALREAQTSGRPLMVKFTTKTCRVCAEVNPRFQNPDVVSRAGAYVCVALDAEKETKLALSMEPPVKDVPDVRFLAPNRQPLARLGGPMKVEDITKTLDEVLQKYQRARIDALKGQIGEMIKKNNYRYAYIYSSSTLARKKELGLTDKDVAEIEKVLLGLQNMAQKILEVAKELEGKGDVQRAVTQYYMLTFAFPDHPVAKDARAALDRLKADPARGAEVTALVNEADAQALYLFGEQQEKEKRYLLAQRSYGDSVKRAPNSDWGKKAGDALSRMSADPAIQEVVKKENEIMPRMWAEEALAAERKGDRAEAERMWKAILAEFPTHPMAATARAKLGSRPAPTPKSNGSQGPPGAVQGGEREKKAAP